MEAPIRPELTLLSHLLGGIQGVQLRITHHKRLRHCRALNEVDLLMRGLSGLEGARGGPGLEKVLRRAEKVAQNTVLVLAQDLCHGGVGGKLSYKKLSVTQRIPLARSRCRMTLHTRRLRNR